MYTQSSKLLKCPFNPGSVRGVIRHFEHNLPRIPDDQGKLPGKGKTVVPVPERYTNVDFILLFRQSKYVKIDQLNSTTYSFLVRVFYDYIQEIL